MTSIMPMVNKLVNWVVFAAAVCAEIVLPGGQFLYYSPLSVARLPRRSKFDLLPQKHL
jgi:hypothetical protein